MIFNLFQINTSQTNTKCIKKYITRTIIIIMAINDWLRCFCRSECWLRFYINALCTFEWPTCLFCGWNKTVKMTAIPNGQQSVVECNGSTKSKPYKTTTTTFYTTTKNRIISSIYFIIFWIQLTFFYSLVLLDSDTIY